MNIDFYTKAEIDAKLGGLSFIKISQAEYNAIVTKDPDTIYYVYDENGNITQYIGETKMSSGTSNLGAAFVGYTGTKQSFAGTATVNEEE